MYSSIRCTGFILLALGLAAPATQAQNATAAAPQQSTRGKVFTSADVKAWNTIRQTALSADGKWFAYVLAPNEGNATVVVRGTAQGAAETKIPVGENGGSVAISGDSKWLGLIVAPPRAATSNANAGRAGRGAGRRRNGG